MCTSTVSMCTLVLLLLSAEDYYYAYIVNTTNLISLCRSVHVEGFIIHFGKPGGAFWCLSDPITLRFFLDNVLFFFKILASIFLISLFKSSKQITCMQEGIYVATCVHVIICY